MQKFLIAAMFLLVTIVTKAQQEGVIEKAPNDIKVTTPDYKKQKIVTVKIKGDKVKEDKITIEIDGDKIKVNGKDAGQIKDVDVTIGTNSITFNSLSPKILELRRNLETQKRLNGVLHELQHHNNFDYFFKDRAILGIGMKKVDDGVAITNITESSGAEKAGLKEGDIITKINDTPIVNEMDITKIVNAEKPGAVMEITYKRNGKEQKTKATLGKREMDHEALGMPLNIEPFESQNNLPDLYGHLDEMRPMEKFNFDFNGTMPDMQIFGNGEFPGFSNTPKLGLTLKETESGTGLEVTDIEENSAAAKAGLQKGDIVTTVAGNTISSITDIKKSVAENHKKPFEIKYLRNGKEQKTEIKFPKKLKEVEL